MLPFLPMLGVLGSLIGGAASVAKVNDSKAARRQLEELQRHDRAWNRAADCISLRINTDSDCISAPLQTRTGCSRKKNAKETIKMSSGATINVQLNEFARRMRIPYFRAILFMHNTLPTRRTPKRKRYREFGRYDGAWYSLDSVREEEQSRRIQLTVSVIFDPRNWCDILETVRRRYNRTFYQTYDQSFCGQICLRFLQMIDAREFKKFDEVLWNLCSY